MLDDILAFAAATLVDRGRLSFWMPTANDEDQEIPVPTHPSLELVVICVQKFNKCKYFARVNLTSAYICRSVSVIPGLVL